MKSGRGGIALCVALTAGCGSKTSPPGVGEMPSGTGGGAASQNDGGTSGAMTCSSAPVQATEPNSVTSLSMGNGGPGTCAGALEARASVFGAPWGDAGPGAPCTDPVQCRPTCCACPGPGRSAVTSWCNYGQCASPEGVCCMVAGSSLKSCGYQ